MSVSANAPLLEVRNLGVRLNTSRGPAQAVRGVSFALERGETLGLVGEIRLRQVDHRARADGPAARERRQVSGSIRFDGRELVGLPDARCASCAATASA